MEGFVAGVWRRPSGVRRWAPGFRHGLPRMACWGRSQDQVPGSQLTQKPILDEGRRATLLFIAESIDFPRHQPLMAGRR